MFTRNDKLLIPVLPRCIDNNLHWFVQCLSRRHTLSRRRVVPLPRWRANPDTDPDALFAKHTVDFV